jgi:hypothetical protein
MRIGIVCRACLYSWAISGALWRAGRQREGRPRNGGKHKQHQDTIQDSPEVLQEDGHHQQDMIVQLDCIRGTATGKEIIEMRWNNRQKGYLVSKST